MSEKYRVHEMVRFRYSDIGEYVDEYHTDRPLRNDKLVDLLNEQDKTIKELEKENKHLQCKIESNSQDDYIDYLKKENEQLKDFIKKLGDDTGRIVLMNGYGYHISKVIK